MKLEVTAEVITPKNISIASDVRVVASPLAVGELIYEAIDSMKTQLSWSPEDFKLKLTFKQLPD